MDIVDYVTFKEVFCFIMGIKSSPNNVSDDLTCHLRSRRKCWCKRADG